MKMRYVIPVFLFWSLLHADQGGGFFTAYGMHEIAVFYQYHFEDAFAGLAPLLVPLILTLISVLPFALLGWLTSLKRRDSSPGGAS